MTDKIITATVHKPFADTKVGISFVTISGKLHVLSVSGLFAQTKITPLSMVIAVNTKAATDMTASECKEYICQLSGDVTIVATNTAGILATGKSNDGYSYLPDNPLKLYNINYHERIPPMLVDVGVSREKWVMLVNSVEQELFPSLQKVIELEKTVERARDDDNAKKLYTALAMARTEVAMVGSNILARATCLMSPHGIVPQLVTEDTKPFQNDRAKFVNGDSSAYVHLSSLKFSLPKGIKFINVTQEISVPTAVEIYE